MTARMRRIPRPNNLTPVLKEFGARHRLLDQLQDELVRRYPDQWVALTPNRTLVAADRPQELIQRIHCKGLSSNGAAIRFMSTSPRRMII